jgi:hypothetical protein
VIARLVVPIIILKPAMPSTVKHIFARQTEAMGLFVRTIGIERARTKNGLADAPSGIGLTLRDDHRGITIDAHRLPAPHTHLFTTVEQS